MARLTGMSRPLVQQGVRISSFKPCDVCPNHDLGCIHNALERKF